MEIVLGIVLAAIAVISIVSNLYTIKVHSKCVKDFTQTHSSTIKEFTQRQRELEEFAFIEARERRTYLDISQRRADSMIKKEEAFPPGFFHPSFEEEEEYLGGNRRLMHLSKVENKEKANG